MSVTVHGRAGASVSRGALRYGAAVAARAAGFEAETGRALEEWLAAAEGEYHLFHDLTGLTVRVSRWEERSLGRANIDHVILAASGLIVVNAKACGAGSLTLRKDRGTLVSAAGTARPQPWLDQTRDYSLAAALTRCAGLISPRVSIAWVVPDATDTSAPLLRLARCLFPPPPRREMQFGLRACLELERPRFGTGTIVTLSKLRGGVLASAWPRYFGGTTPPADSAAALAVFVRGPGPKAGPRPPRGMVAGPDGRPVYPWQVP